MRLLSILYQSLIARSDISSKRLTVLWMMIIYTIQMILEPVLNYRFNSEILIAELTFVVTLFGVATWEVSKTTTTNTDKTNP